MLVDCGVGDKMDAEAARTSTRSTATRHLDHALAEVGLTADAIDVALATHLHFDHFGGATARQGQAIVPAIPQRAVPDSGAPNGKTPRIRTSATAPAICRTTSCRSKDAGVVDFFDGDQTIRPGVRVVRTGGHTGQHQIVFIESGGRTAVFVADMIPTTAHIQDPWIMGYDLFPMETLAFKKRFIREAIDREYLIFFEHDPLVAAGYIREKRRDGGYVEQVL